MKIHTCTCIMVKSPSCPQGQSVTDKCTHTLTDRQTEPQKLMSQQCCMRIKMFSIKCYIPMSRKITYVALFGKYWNVCIIINNNVIALECWFVFLDFHHDVMYIDELVPYLQITEWSLRQHLLESVIVLYQLGQGSLKQHKQITEWSLKQH